MSEIDGTLTLRDLIREIIHPVRIIRALRVNGTSATVNRLFKSRHVLDLKLFLSVSICAAIIASILVLSFELLDHVLDFFTKWNSGALGSTGILAPLLDSLAQALWDSATVIGPLFAVLGLIAAWAYRAAAKRLGVVSLFASEITELCRVGTVFDTARRFTQLYESYPEHLPSDNEAGDLQTRRHSWNRFNSEEEYFPVFNDNSRDLQLLEADVVTNITAFYTYMKTMRDLLRQLSVADAPDKPSSVKDQWHNSLRHVIYMLFLSYEKARDVVCDLVEYEPNRDECLLMILITEIEAFGFLRDHFSISEDPRNMRLSLRVGNYKDFVPDLCRRVSENAITNPNWGKANAIVNEVKVRYYRVFKESI